MTSPDIDTEKGEKMCNGPMTVAKSVEMNDEAHVNSARGG